MNSEDLIDAMTADLRSVPRHAVMQRLLMGIVGGATVSIVLVVLFLGFRSDLEIAMHGFAFWMKWAYTTSLGVGAVVMVRGLSRPMAGRLSRYWPLAIPIVLLTIFAGVELSQAPRGDWLALWLGQTWSKCPGLVLLLSAPIYFGLLWSFRQLAPTQLGAAGGAAGMASGSWAAAIYCLHCPEVSALFVLTWYTLGIGLAAVIGAWTGPKLLRW